jgi:phosphatidate phosphatase APP1
MTTTRIYSNVILNWPRRIHLFQAARLCAGDWNEYHLYRITNAEPFRYISKSPLQILETNRQYYCYDLMGYNKNMTRFGNKYSYIIEPDVGKRRIFYPSTITAGDFIAVQKPETYIPVYY